MRVYAYAKINWALNIGAARPDGYHEMDMLMQSVSLCDVLDIESADVLELSCDRREMTGPDNLILRAAGALNAHAGARHGASIRLTKCIPSRAGLGGGSADCAAALVALNRMWGLNLDMEELLRIGLKLGADVPFCLVGGAARVRGIGERVEPLKAPAPIPLLIVHPGGGLSTPEMFRAFDREPERGAPADIEACARALAEGDLLRMRRFARNMFSPVAEKVLPEIGAVRRVLVREGAIFAQMSGSGSAVFGAYPDMKTAERARSIIGDHAILCETTP